MKQPSLEEVLKVLEGCEWKKGETESTYTTRRGPYRFVLYSSSGLGPIDPHVDLTVRNDKGEKVTEYTTPGYFGPLKTLFKKIENERCSAVSKHHEEELESFSVFLRKNDIPSPNT